MSNRSLQEVVKGAGLIFAGTFLIYALKFIYRLIVSRYLGPSDYGLLSLGDGVLNIALLFVLLGLSSGVVKFIPHYLSAAEPAKVKGTILATFKVIGFLGIFTSAALIIFSNYIAIGIFHNNKLAPLLVILALAVPFYATSNIFSSIFVSFKKVQYRNYTVALVRPLSSLLLVIVIVLLSKDVYWIAAAYLTSHILASFFGFYLLESKTFSLIKSKIKAVYNYKEMLTFSIPVFFSDIFISVMGWIDTFFLGVLKTTADVGIYNVALPLVSTLTIFFSAFENMFYPISAELYQKKDYQQIASIYSSISRWMFLLSLPILIIVLIFPKDILTILFGSAYKEGAIVLQVLISAYFIRVIAGPSARALMTFNRTKTIFYINSLGAITNFVLNYALISAYGLFGAALATATSLLFKDLVLFFIAKKAVKFKLPLKSYLKYTFCSLVPLVPLFILKNNFNINLIILPLIIIIYTLLYFIMLIILKSFNQEDHTMIEAIEKKTGISLRLIKRFI